MSVRDMAEPVLQSDQRVDHGSIRVPTEIMGGDRRAEEELDSIGCLTCRGTDEDIEGNAVLKTNQDYACTARPFRTEPGTALFCVCDGHGRHGHHVSQEVLHALVFELEANAQQLIEAPALTLTSSFDAVNVHLRALSAQEVGKVNATSSGACCVVAFVRGNDLWVAGCGDCRAVLGTLHEGSLVAVGLSTDHKVDAPAEQERIEASGGFVKPSVADEDDEDYILPAKLYRDAAFRRGPGLCIARTFGDLDAAGIGVIATPTMINHSILVEDTYLVLASDGVWEFLPNESVINMVHTHFLAGKRAQDACLFIIAKAAAAWREFEGAYRDDITVVVVYLSPLAAALQDELATVEGHAFGAATAAAPS